MAVPAALLLTTAIAIAVVVGGNRPFDEQSPSGEVMLILRGIANAKIRAASSMTTPRANTRACSVIAARCLTSLETPTAPQAKIALDRIHHDDKVTAIYGFSGGGYNTRRVWSQVERRSSASASARVVVIGSPGVSKSDFPASADVIIKQDPPAGHMAGPRALLEALDVLARSRLAFATAPRSTWLVRWGRTEVQ